MARTVDFIVAAFFAILFKGAVTASIEFWDINRLIAYCFIIISTGCAVAVIAAILPRSKQSDPQACSKGKL